MEEIEFKEGDVVQLKSGGQSMTIEKFTWDLVNSIFYTDKVDCVWFDAKNVLQNKSFKTILLKHV